MNKFNILNDGLIVNKISKSFLTSKKISVLKKINFKFNLGKIYSIVGPSGSGKSTLLNILSLIDKPTSGFVKINGNNDKNTIHYNILKKLGL